MARAHPAGNEISEMTEQSGGRGDKSDSSPADGMLLRLPAGPPAAHDGDREQHKCTAV
ncbi:hypothetical protein D3C74_448580 [compost metagenome]